MGNNFWNSGVSGDWETISGCLALGASEKRHQKFSEHRRALSVVAAAMNAKADGSKILHDQTGFPCSTGLFLGEKYCSEPTI
jgi:hypothetical protein